jgi:hypothetical protein
VVRTAGATTAAGLGALAGTWSAASPGLSAVGAASIAAAAFVLVVAARTHGDRTLGPVATVVAVAGAAASVGTAVVGLGAGGRAGLGAAGATAVGLALLAATVLDPLGLAEDEDGDLSWAAEGAGWLVHLAVLFQLLVVAGPDAAGVVLGSGALAAGIHAIRPGRRPMVALAAAEGLLLVWLQLASAGVSTAEAYTLPAAAALLAAGLVGHRRAAARDRLLPSWATVGPALVVAFAPTVVLAFGDPGLVRPLVGLAAGAAVLAAGAVTGRRAPVDVGAAVVTVLGLRQLAPVAAQLPSWSVLAATGAFLVVLGATFEQRRRDLHDARHRYAGLR